ncbi:hypothetical protein JTB14_034444 [Gonioctena quinquepunctata]|nr:hypothetical protein JTB14_034444 [Gonioctena quinquepunctata]
MIPVIHHFLNRNSKYLKNIPGPKPNIFFGNLIDFIGPRDGILKTVMGYLETYGPHVKLHDGPLSICVFSADEKFMELFLSSPTLIDKSDEYSFFHNWLGTGLLTSTGSKWRKRRKLLTPSFHFSILGNSVDIFDRVGDVFIRNLEKEVGKASFDIHPLVSLCTLDIICEAAMGSSLNAQDEGSSEYVQSVKTMCAIIMDRIFSPLDVRLYPFTLNFFREKKAVRVLHAHTDAIIDRRIKERRSEKSGNVCDEIGMKKKLAFLDMLLENRTYDGMPLSRADIREEVDTFMFEGHDTTSSAISFGIYCLANNPEVQKKAIEEQRRIFGKVADAIPTLTNLQEMKYLDLVIKETLRLYPSVPIIGRRVPEDFEWGGSIYQKGLNITLLPFASHRDPKYFPEPLKFIPERFENSDGKNPYIYVPFSAGPRNCIGQKFAMLEMKSTISKVLRNFELFPATPAHPLRLASEVILVSKNGVCISIQKRIE